MSEPGTVIRGRYYPSATCAGMETYVNAKGITKQSPVLFCNDCDKVGRAYAQAMIDIDEAVSNPWFHKHALGSIKLAEKELAHNEKRLLPKAITAVTQDLTRGKINVLRSANATGQLDWIRHAQLNYLEENNPGLVPPREEADSRSVFQKLLDRILSLFARLFW